MMNITSRLAIRIQHLPDWPVDWSDVTPVGSRLSLSLVDFMPTEEDAGYLQKRATGFMMRFLVREFSDLKDLARYAPDEEQVHTVDKSEVVPMMVLFKDEKFVSETIDIMAQLIEDAHLSGNPEVCIQTSVCIKPLVFTFINHTCKF